MSTERPIQQSGENSAPGVVSTSAEPRRARRDSNPQPSEFKVRMSRDVEVPDTVSILWTSQKGSSQGRSLVETAVWRDLLRQPEAKYGDPRNM